jgi:hypothetical protein
MRRHVTGRNPPVPRGIQAAAALFVLYGVSAFLNAVVVLREAGWASPRGWVRAVIELMAAGLVAWGLVRRARWAWGLGVVLGCFWLVTGGITTLVVQRGDLYWLPPSGFQLLLTGSLVCLGVAVALLLSPAGRAAFRKPAG